MKALGEKLMSARIGAFELATSATLLAVLVGTRAELLLGAALSVIFGWAKWRFKGEFSLRDCVAMFKS